jgi:hypothetical protein
LRRANRYYAMRSNIADHHRGCAVRTAYVKQLYAEVAEMEARRQERDLAQAQAVRERLTPLEQRVVRLLSTIPVTIQKQGLSLAVLQTSLRGRRRGNAHPGEIGAVLRKLGFKRERRWHDDAGFRALWYRA